MQQSAAVKFASGRPVNAVAMRYSTIMNVGVALADIDSALNDPPAISTGGIAAVTEMTNRLHACICRYAPPGSTWRVQGNRYVEHDAKSGLNAGRESPEAALRGVLVSLRRDLAAGRLAHFEELVHANVYADLLAQSDGLLRDGYARAASVIAGAALEEHIKKLVTKHGTGVTLTHGAIKKASQMNSDLKAAKVYSEAQRAAVESWQKLRNEAAHGAPGFDGSDIHLLPNVGPMISGIRGFLTQYPA